MSRKVCDGSSPKGLAICPENRPSSVKPLANATVGCWWRAEVPGGQQLLARPRQPRLPHPAHRRGAEMKLELRLQRARADASGRGELVEHDWLVQPAVQPLQRMPDAGWQVRPHLRHETVIYWKARLRAHRATLRFIRTVWRARHRARPSKNEHKKYFGRADCGSTIGPRALHRPRNRDCLRLHAIGRVKAISKCPGIIGEQDNSMNKHCLNSSICKSAVFIATCLSGLIAQPAWAKRVQIAFVSQSALMASCKKHAGANYYQQSGGTYGCAGKGVVECNSNTKTCTGTVTRTGSGQPLSNGGPASRRHGWHLR